MVKSAFTMIELIFAIVIIAIAVLSLSVMNNTTSKTIENNLVQEAIFAASTELIGTTVGYWDENSMQDKNESSIARVINIGNDCNASTKLRYGHINQPYHRRCLDNLETRARSSAGGDVYDLDDAAHAKENIFVDDTTDASGYKQTYTSTIKVTQDGDIKTITSTIRDKDDVIITRLKAQSANIGETEYFKRVF